MGRLFHLPQIRDQSVLLPRNPPPHPVPKASAIYFHHHTRPPRIAKTLRNALGSCAAPLPSVSPRPNHNAVVSWSRHWEQVPLNGLDFFGMPSQLPVQFWTQLHYHLIDLLISIKPNPRYSARCAKPPLRPRVHLFWSPVLLNSSLAVINPFRGCAFSNGMPDGD